MSETPSPSEYLRPYLTTENYRALLADYCQTVDQVSKLAGTVAVLWKCVNQLCSILDLPAPVAGSLAGTHLPVMLPQCAGRNGTDAMYTPLAQGPLAQGTPLRCIPDLAAVVLAGEEG